MSYLPEPHPDVLARYSLTLLQFHALLDPAASAKCPAKEIIDLKERGLVNAEGRTTEEGRVIINAIFDGIGQP